MIIGQDNNRRLLMIEPLVQSFARADLLENLFFITLGPSVFKYHINGLLNNITLDSLHITLGNSCEARVNEMGNRDGHLKKSVSA